MKTNNKCAAVRLEKSKLVAALAILAVAFVVIAAVPAIDVDGESAATPTNVGVITELKGDKEGTYKLTTNLETSSSISISAKITLDLNGFTLKGKNCDTISVTTTGNLTIIDNSDNKTGTVDVVGDNFTAITNAGTAILNGGTIERSAETGIIVNGVKLGDKEDSYYTIKNNGTLTINDGTIVKNLVPTEGMIVTGASSNICNGGDKEATLTINGGTIDGGLNAVKNDFYGVLTIKDGAITNQIQVAVMNWGEATIEGGSFTGNQSALWVCSWLDSGTKTASAGNLTVKGGSFTNGSGWPDLIIQTNSIYNSIYNSKDTEYEDQPVFVTSEKNITIGCKNTEANIIIKKDVAVEFTDGSILPKSISYNDGNKTSTVAFTDVKAGKTGVTFNAGSVEITGTMNASDVAAKITAAAGDVVLKDLTITAGNLALDKNVTVDGTLTIDAGAGLNLTSVANLTVNGKILVKEKTTDKNAAKIDGTGKIAVNEKGSIVVGGTIDNDVKLTNNGVISIINEKAEIPATITGNGSVDISAVASEGTISGDWNTVTTYTQNQTITLTGDTVLKEGSQIIVKGKMIIPEGVTLTIEDGAQLVIYSSTGILENNGKIVVQSSVGAVSYMKNASEYNETNPAWTQLTGVNQTGGLVNIGAEIINDGVIDLSYTLPSNASEDQKYATHPQFNNSGKLTNNGQIEVGSESFLYFWGGMTNSADATITVLGLMQHDANGEQISNAGIISFNGAIRENGMSIALTSTDAKVDFVSLESIIGTNTITVKNDLKASGSNTYNGTPAVAVSVAKDFTVKGLVVTPAVVLQENSKTAYDRYVVIEGSVICDTEKETVPSASPVVITVTGKIKVDAALALGAGVDMKIGSTSPTTTSGELYVNGTMTSVAGKINNSGTELGSVSISTESTVTVTGKITASKTLGTTGINAAFYKIDKTTTAPESYVYTTLDQAVADGAKKIEIYGTTKVSVDVAVPSGTTVKVNTGADLKITKDSTVTIASGAVLNNGGSVDVKGTLYIEVVKTGLKGTTTSITSEVVINGEKDRTYTTLVNAIVGASAGSTIELSDDVTLTSDLTIPEGIKVDTNGKTFTIPANYTLTVDGELFLNGSTSTVTMNLKDAAKVEEDGKFVVNGTVSSTDDILVKVKLGTATYTVPGAYYSITEGVNITYYVEPVAKAAAKIAQADGSKLEIRSQDADGIKIGDVSFSGTEDASAVVEVYTKLTASSITLDRASVVFMADEEFNGSFTNGTGTVSAIGTAKNGFTVASSTSKDVKTLSVTGQFADSGKDDKFAVSGEVTLKAANISKVVVDGTAKVDKTSSSKITTIGTLTVNGTVEVQNDAALNVTEDLEVLGAFSAAAMTNEKPAGSATAKNVFVGISKKNSIRTYPATSGAAASVSGKVIANGYTVVADGSSVPETLTKDIDSTAYFIGDKAYVTVYAVSATKIGVVKATVENAEWTGWYADEKTKTNVDDKNVGEDGCEKVYAIIDYEIYNVAILADAGIDNIAIDGNLLLYNDGGYIMPMESELKAGSHTITYTLKNGYSGDAKLTLVKSGDKTSASINGLNFTISGEKGGVVFQLSGITASGYVDPTPTPAPSTGDDKLTITDYLLIILVVLIVIMAIIVAMRLMRS